MATFRQRGKKWQAMVFKNGVRKSATRDTKAEAKAWAATVEAELAAESRGEIPPDKTFGDLLRRYQETVSVNKRGAVWEATRIEKTIRDEPIAKVLLTKLSAVDVAAWRDRRLTEVQAASVLREWNILSHACTIARIEWHWLRLNPFADVSAPPSPPARTRRVSQDEIDRLLVALGCDPQVTPTTKTALVGFAMLFAIETGMRAGEILGLAWRDIVAEGTVANLFHTKNGSDRRVPLSIEARRLLSLLPRTKDTAPVFDVDGPSLDILFRKAKKRVGIDDLHFHDTRREALTRLAAKVDVMTLAKISGHRDLRILQNTYYAPRMEDVVGLLG